MTKSNLLKAAGRFGVRYGQSVKRRIAEIENKQRQKQQCIFCGKTAKRLSKGIWQCKKCGKKFAGHAYFLEKQEMPQAVEMKTSKKEAAKALKKENTSENKPKSVKSKRKTKKSESK